MYFGFWFSNTKLASYICRLVTNSLCLLGPFILGHSIQIGQYRGIYRHYKQILTMLLNIVPWPIRKTFKKNFFFSFLSEGKTNFHVNKSSCSHTLSHNTPTCVRRPSQSMSSLCKSLPFSLQIGLDVPIVNPDFVW